ncbi:sugar ABC transporter substrate-binding protein [Nonomuraea deserti]|uniref:Sugar ABC transporter substrate-binding protein n=1 Tax=Nonomuraea deserti TaxID=1848322 RepID=A0A4V2YCK8_9ACTN|nr:sugar ABC transporter substrate-binding protein [Nonomuraea deserti]
MVIWPRRLGSPLLSLAAVAMLLVSACGGGAGATGRDPVRLTFWAWVPGMDKAVELFNRTHDDVQVTLDNIPPGPKGGYAKMHAAVLAGDAPCLAQMEFQELPSFLLNVELTDLNPYLTDADRADFQQNTWDLVTYEGGTYAVPQATGPMALYYRADLFDKWGIEVPKTWAEYREAAARVREADPDAYVTNFPANDTSPFISLAWQAGTPWFDTRGGVWNAKMTSQETLKVADYWQGMIKDGLVKVSPHFAPGWYKDLASGHLVAIPLAQWAEAILAANAPDTAGKWRAAPLPQWEAGGKASASNGGSSTALLRGCEHPREAVEFALWINRDPRSVAMLIESGYGWPAAIDGMSSPSLTKPSAFLGGQRTDQLFTESSSQVPRGWVWWPGYEETRQRLNDSFPRALAGEGTFASALRAAQTQVVEQLREKGLRAQ